VAAWLNRNGNVGSQKIPRNYLAEIVKKIFDAVTFLYMIRRSIIFQYTEVTIT